jgi:hypothetical protein
MQVEIFIVCDSFKRTLNPIGKTVLTFIEPFDAQNNSAVPHAG